MTQTKIATSIDTGRIVPGDHTPWGAAEHITIFREPDALWSAPVVAFVSTPSHGGFYVPLALRSKFPAKVLALTFANGQGLRGWFEQDADAPLVPLFLPTFFKPEEQKTAEAALRAMVGGHGPSTLARMNAMAKAGAEALGMVCA